MQLPFLLTCSEPAVGLYELADGRFQLIKQGPIAPLMTGYRHLLVESSLAEFLQCLPIERVRYEPAVLVNRGTGEEHRTHSRIVVSQFFRPDDLRDIPLEGMRILTMNDEYFFVTAELKNALEASPFQYLQFSEGLSNFAAG
ncbi:hypothetical protein ACG04R_03080 [Roseateles sp. BYS78W]|uniref:Uncharacterized protein n=1 Tax=Pelomonas candidula TaxID=3299025 RepID=A0ABW7H6W0_9BURK